MRALVICNYCGHKIKFTNSYGAPTACWRCKGTDLEIKKYDGNQYGYEEDEKEDNVPDDGYTVLD